MSLVTTDRLRLEDNRGEWNAPGISVEFFVEKNDACRVRVNLSQTSDTDAGVVDTIDYRLTAAEMNIINDEYLSVVAMFRSVVESVAQVVLSEKNPSATIDFTA